MVIIATVTKKAVTDVMPKLHTIVLNMVVTDAGKEVINRDYSAYYRPNDIISKNAPPLTAMMQKDIDAYKSEQVIYKKAAIGTLVTTVQNALVV